MTAIGVSTGQGAEARTAGAHDWPMIAFLCALPLGILARVNAGWGLPLWFDEVFTGTIAGQRSFAGLLDWCLTEITGPVYYMPMWLWARIAGTSDLALRVPSLVFAVATPLMIAWRGHPDRNVRLLWATLCLLWLPILPMATEARCYPQLLFLTALQATLFLPFARAPGKRIAVAWATVTSLAVLTHYYAILIGGFQGLALIALHRRALLRLWPVGLPFVAAAAWMAFHLHFLLTFASAYMTSYSPMPLAVSLAFPLFLFGPGIQGFVVLGLIAVTARGWWREAPKRSPEALLIWSGIAAFALLFISGLFRATMMPRYLTPGIPALLFGIACWANHMRQREWIPVAIVFASLFAAMAAALAFGSDDLRFRDRRHFEYETASAWLAQKEPQRLHFLWSTPVGAQSDSAYLRQVAGFFFARSGHPVAVAVSRGGSDYNRALAAAGDDPRAAILWLSDNVLPRGVVPGVDRIDPRFECRDFGGERILVYACRRR